MDGYNVCVGKEEDLMLTGTWLVRLKLLAGLRFLPPALLPRLLLDALLAEFFLFLLLVVVCRVGSALHQTHKQEDRCTHRKEVLIKHKCTHPHSQTCHTHTVHAHRWRKKTFPTYTHIIQGKITKCIMLFSFFFERERERIKEHSNISQDMH